MRNTLLMMLLAAASSSAAAEWIKVIEGYRLVAYADPATIRRSGNFARMWHLLDFKDAQGSRAGGRYWSLKAEFEYDCEGERSRLHFYSFHSANMGEGITVVARAVSADWEPIAPGSNMVALSQTACGAAGTDIDYSHRAEAREQAEPQPNIATSPPQSRDVTFSIPLRQRHGVFEVMATLNSEVNVFFVVHSGASVVTIPEDVASLLVRNGSLTRADFLGFQRYRFANGTIGSGKVIRLRSLDLGGHTLKDVPAVVLAGNHVPTLLGQTVLGQLGNWSINTKAQTLQVTP